MNLERQCPHHSCQPGSVECKLEEGIQVGGNKAATIKAVSKQSSIPPEESSSLLHWKNRRVKLFAVKALAIILLLGYLGREHSIKVIQQVSSRRRLTYVSPSKSLQTKLSTLSASKLSQTARNHHKQSTSMNSASNHTKKGLRGASPSSTNAQRKSSSITMSSDVTVEGTKRVSPKD